MAINKSDVPVFRGAIMGYNKTEVDDYVARTESELDIQDSRMKKWESQNAELNKKIQDLSKMIDTENAEKEEILERNKKLGKKIADLEDRLKEANLENKKLRKEFAEFQESMNVAGVNPKMIQDAILNAQRMSEIVITEANEKAEEIMMRAQDTRHAQEEAGRKAVEEAKEEALRVTELAAKKCENLQKDYDRILMDVTGFKAEIMRMYRKHMALLAALPEKRTSEIFHQKDYIDGEFKDVKEEEIME